MTTPQEFYVNVVAALDYLDTKLPPGSHLSFMGIFFLPFSLRCPPLNGGLPSLFLTSRRTRRWKDLVRRYGLEALPCWYDSLSSVVSPCFVFSLIYVGQLNGDVTYSQFYDYMNCLEISPCFGWMVCIDSNFKFSSYLTPQLRILMLIGEMPLLRELCS